MRKEDRRVRSKKPSHVAVSHKRDKEVVVVAVIHRENRRRGIQCGECLSRSTAQPVLDMVETSEHRIAVDWVVFHRFAVEDCLDLTVRSREFYEWMHHEFPPQVWAILMCIPSRADTSTYH